MTYDDLPATEQVPAYYTDDKRSGAIIRATTDQALTLQDAMWDVVAQLYVSTATWGLAAWEEELGITTDESLSVEQRRGAIITKLLGHGTCNAAMMEDIAKAITGLEAEVEEDPANYSFSLSFWGDAPSIVSVDREALIEQVGVVKPAHLEFVIVGIRWRDVHAMSTTWRDIEESGTTWRDVHEKVPLQQKIS